MRNIFRAAIASGIAVATACGTLQPAADENASPDGGLGEGGLGPDAERDAAPVKRACAPSIAGFVDGGVITWVPDKPYAMRLGRDQEIYAATTAGGSIVRLVSGPIPASGSLMIDGRIASLTFNSEDSEHPTPSADGNVLVFESKGTGGPSSDKSLWYARRSAARNSFEKPVLAIDVKGLTAGANIKFKDPYFTPTRLYFTHELGDDDQIYAGTFDDGGVPDAIRQLAGKRPVVSDDELEIFFVADTDAGSEDIFHAVRDKPDADFGPPEALSIANTKNDDEPTFLSADACELYVIVDHYGQVVRLKR